MKSALEKELFESCSRCLRTNRKFLQRQRYKHKGQEDKIILPSNTSKQTGEGCHRRGLLRRLPPPPPPPPLVCLPQSKVPLNWQANSIEQYTMQSSQSCPRILAQNPFEGSGTTVEPIPGQGFKSEWKNILSSCDREGGFKGHGILREN